jgi:hypothetical protein
MQWENLAKISQFLDSSKIISMLLISKTSNQVMLDVLLEVVGVKFSQDILLLSIDCRIWKSALSVESGFRFWAESFVHELV